MPAEDEPEYDYTDAAFEELAHRSNENFVKIDKTFDEFARRLEEMKNAIQNLGRKIEQSGAGTDAYTADSLRIISERIDALEKDIAGGRISALPAKPSVHLQQPDISSQLKELSEDLKELKKFHTKTRLNFFEIEKRLVKLESGEGHTEHLKQHTAPALERKLKSMEEKLEERVKSLEDVLMLLEVELVKSRKTGLAAVPSGYEDRLATLEEKIENIERSKLMMPAEAIAQEPRIANLEDNVVSLENRLKKRMQELETRLLSAMTGGIVTEEAANDVMSRIHNEMAEIRIEIEKARMARDDLLKMEKNMAKKDHVNMVNAGMLNQFNALKEQVEHMISAGKTAGVRAVDAESSLQEQFEEYRRFFDNRIVDFEEKIQETVRDEAAKVMLTEEAQKIIHRLESLEREVELRAYGIVVREFETFAEAIDKKFPELVTRKELESRLGGYHAQGAESGMQIQAPVPDITPVMRRINDLEERLNELVEILQTPQSAAVVVE